VAEIRLENVQKYFGPVHVIREVNLTIKDREFCVLLGPSGCGKTTTLRAIAGLESIDEGRILIDGKPVQDLHASDRDIAFVFQLYALYPHLTVFENLAFPLRATRMPDAEVRQTVTTVAQSIGITPLLKLRPSALSGGDMQRVAIGRALVRRPKALLMDEPIGALDAKLREQMRVELKRLHLENGSTSIYVTHDQVEAMSLADTVVVMHDGVLQQVGTPSQVYLHPANLFVAQFIGSPVMNIADAALTQDAGQAAVVLHGQPFALPNEILNRIAAKSPSKSLGDIALGIRPEGIHLSHHESPGARALPVHLIQPYGPFDIIDLQVGTKTLRARTESGFIAAKGQTVWASLDATQAHFFDKTTGASLGIRLA
jgi:multiple sugar transport system ATP-binding protein